MTACGPYAALIDRNNTSRTLLTAKVVAVGRLPGLRRLRGLGRWQRERVSIVAGCMTQLNQKTRAGVDLLSRNPNSHLRTAADDGNVLNLKVSPNRPATPSLQQSRTTAERDLACRISGFSPSPFEDTSKLRVNRASAHPWQSFCLSAMASNVARCLTWFAHDGCVGHFKSRRGAAPSATAAWLTPRNVVSALRCWDLYRERL